MAKRDDGEDPDIVPRRIKSDPSSYKEGLTYTSALRNGSWSYRVTIHYL